MTVSARDLWETYLPAFKTLAVDANVRELVWVHTTATPEIHAAQAISFSMTYCAADGSMTDFVVFVDCGAINDFYIKTHHGTHATPAIASADAVREGTGHSSCGKFVM